MTPSEIQRHADLGDAHADDWRASTYKKPYNGGKLRAGRRIGEWADLLHEQLATPNDRGCIEWTGRDDQTRGYGVIASKGLAKRAHRVAWELANGPIPDGMLVCHHCDNPPCCNVDHLFLGTHADNARDRSVKGRNGNTRVTGEQHGRHKLTAAEVLEIRRLKAEGVCSKELSEMFNISTTTICDVARRHTWRDLQPQTEDAA